MARVCGCPTTWIFSYYHLKIDKPFKKTRKLKLKLHTVNHTLSRCYCYFRNFLAIHLLHQFKKKTHSKDSEEDPSGFNPFSAPKTSRSNSWKPMWSGLMEVFHGLVSGEKTGPYPNPGTKTTNMSWKLMVGFDEILFWLWDPIFRLDISFILAWDLYFSAWWTLLRGSSQLVRC